jgi:hypothetical protein
MIKKRGIGSLILLQITCHCGLNMLHGLEFAVVISLTAI